MRYTAAPKVQATTATDGARQPGGGQQFLGFTLGGDMHALRIQQVREILGLSQMTPLPLTPAFVLGVMNLRGIVVPVIDLGARLGLGPATPGRRSCVVLVDAPPGDDGKPLVMGVLVDAVHEVFRARDEDMEAPPRLGMHVPGHFVQGIVRLRGRAITELDLSSVLAPRALAELISCHGRTH